MNLVCVSFTNFQLNREGRFRCRGLRWPTGTSLFYSTTLAGAVTLITGFELFPVPGSNDCLSVAFNEAALRIEDHAAEDDHQVHGELKNHTVNERGANYILSVNVV